MTELATSADFVVRPATDDDLNYVRKTWLRAHVEDSDWVAHVGGHETYIRGHKPALEAALSRGAVTIACRSSVPSGICGFAATEREFTSRHDMHLVHFVYVKPRWRKLGVARLLLQPLLSERAEYTHKTFMLRQLPMPEAWRFNPYPFLRSDS